MMTWFTISDTSMPILLHTFDMGKWMWGGLLNGQMEVRDMDICIWSGLWAKVYPPFLLIGSTYRSELFHWNLFPTFWGTKKRGSDCDFIWTVNVLCHTNMISDRNKTQFWSFVQSRPASRFSQLLFGTSDKFDRNYQDSYEIQNTSFPPARLQVPPLYN